MMRIILTEQQFNNILEETALCKMGTSGRTSRAQKFAEVCNDNQLLLKNGLSLFKPEALGVLSDIAERCYKDPKFLIEVLEDEDEEIFTDESAKDFVNYRVKGGPRSDSAYSTELAKIKAAELNLGAAERKSRADASLSDDERIKKNRAEAKASREEAFIGNMLDDTAGMPEYDFARKLCAKYPSTFLRGYTVYMFVPNTGNITDANRTNVRQLRQSLLRSGYTMTQSILKRDKANAISYIYFNIEKKTA